VARGLVRCMVWPSRRSVGPLRLHAVSEIKFCLFCFFFSREKCWCPCYLVPITRRDKSLSLPFSSTSSCSFPRKRVPHLKRLQPEKKNFPHFFLIVIQERWTARKHALSIGLCLYKFILEYTLSSNSSHFKSVQLCSDVVANQKQIWL
jgi:hypothetical protein